MDNSLIYALATPRVSAGIALIRLSGAGAVDFVKPFVGGLECPARSLRMFRHKGAVLDQVLVLTFAKGGSFTGEEVVELHCHGSLAVIDAILAVFAESPKTRLAEPGEFTRQAFENGCLDLTQVEGLADLIAAETHEQLVLANRVFGGAFSAKVTAWRADLIRACALLEAMIDFADEDIPQDLEAEVLSLIDKTIKSMRSEITGTKIAERIRNGFEVAIIGRPNIGKSTLLNTLAGRKVALTSEIAGTTRDIIEVRMDIKGLPVTILDTAGLRDTDDTVESLGVDWARDRAEAADIRVFLLDDMGLDGLGISVQKDDIILRGKVDETPDFKGAGVSGKTGQGIDFVMKNIVRILSPRILSTQTATRQRHRVAMQSATSALQQAGDSIKSDSFAVELVATDIRSALSSLNHMIGAVGVENILDEIFASFCLGK